MKPKHALLVAFACLGEAQAGAPHTYQLGQAAATARFKFDLAGPGGAQIYDDGETCKGISRVTPGSWLTVKAEQPLTFVSFGASSNSLFNYRFCRANVTFEPVANASYVAQLVLSDATCRVVVSRQLDDGSFEQVQSYLREYKAPFLQSGSWCGKRLDD